MTTQLLYNYEVTLLSGRVENFITNVVLTKLTDIYCVDLQGVYIGTLSITLDKVETVFYKGVGVQEIQDKINIGVSVAPDAEQGEEPYHPILFE